MDAQKFDLNVVTGTRWFKSQPIVSFTDAQIDEENGIIKDVIMCEPGPAKGHGVHLDQEFINDLVKYDVEHFSKSRLKSRFSHPSMSNTTMGSQLGHFFNFKVKDNKAVADLKILDSAELSPTNPKMRSWLLSMAKESPDFIMSSIVVQAGEFYQKDSDGNKYVLATRIEKTHNYKVVNEYDEDLGDVYLGLGEKGDHYYTDIVEKGAATESLFSQQFNKDKFAVTAVEFLQDHPEIHEFLKNNPSKLTEFAEKAGIELPSSKEFNNRRWKKFQEFFTTEDKPEIDLSEYIKLSDHQTKVDELTKKLNDIETANAEVLSGKDTEITALKAQISELEKQPDEPPTNLGEEPPVTGENNEYPLYKMDSVTQSLINRK